MLIVAIISVVKGLCGADEINWVVPRFEREARRISEAEDKEMSRKIEEYRDEHPRPA